MPRLAAPCRRTCNASRASSRWRCGHRCGRSRGRPQTAGAWRDRGPDPDALPPARSARAADGWRPSRLPQNRGRDPREVPLALEIERRFLVTGEQWRHHCRWQARLRQGYLTSSRDGLTVRVRTSETVREAPIPAAGPGEQSPGAVGQTQAWLTLKAPPPPAGRGTGQARPDQAPAAAAELALTRLEFDYAIPLGDAEAMLALTGRQVVKQRFGLDLPGGDWVLDVFEGTNAPLVVVEVELQAADQAVAVPPWCGPEITGRGELSNAALASHPLAAWSAAERLDLLGGS